MKTESLAAIPVSDFLARLASNAPTPGGGAAAALVGAVAAGVARMVGAYTIGRPKYAANESELRAMDAELERAQAALQAMIDEDAAAYEVLSAALKLPKTDPERAPALERAASLAAAVPLEVALIAARIGGYARRLATIGNPMLRSDAECAEHFALAALRSAVANVRTNLPLMHTDDRGRFTTELEKLAGSGLLGESVA